MSEFRWGILGAANIARSFIRGVRRTPDAGVIAAVASRTVEKAAAFAEEFDISLHLGSYGELLDSSIVDAIYNPLPNSMHMEWCIRCAAAGIPVLCEKPFTVNAGEAQGVADAAARYGVPVAEAFMYRFHPQYQRLRELLAEGAIGKVVSLHAVFSHALHGKKIVQADPKLGGGVLLDLGAYCVSVSRLVTGHEPMWVRSHSVRRDIDHAFFGLMQFPRGITATFEASFEGYQRRRVAITGSHGEIIINRPWHGGVDSGELLLRRDGKEETVVTPGGDPYGLEAQDFVRAVTTNSAPRWDLSDTISNMKIIDTLYQSEESGGKQIRLF